MGPEDKERALDTIRENIARSGYHLYVVSGAQQPRFAYTIGLSHRFGREFILAGAVLYMYAEVARIIESIAAQLDGESALQGSIQQVSSYGSFALRAVHPSWASELMLGAFDFYKKPDVAAVQIVPDKDHWKVDVPDMSIGWSPDTSAAWRWLKEPWTYPVPASSHATTDLDALRGSSVTEACRWEVDYWELFAGAGPDIVDTQKRVVPLGTLLAADPSLIRVLEIPVGEGVWRNEATDWKSGSPPNRRATHLGRNQFSINGVLGNLNRAAFALSPLPDAQNARTCETRLSRSLESPNGECRL